MAEQIHENCYINRELSWLSFNERVLLEAADGSVPLLERLKFLMLRAQKASGEKKLQCGSFTTTLQANPEKVVMDEQYIENIPEKYLIPQDPKIDKKLMLEDLKSDVAVPDLEGVAHIEVGQSLRIR